MALLNHLHDLLASREPPKTFCPSEVARRLTADELQDLGYGKDWRNAMPEIRRLAFELRAQGEVEVLQKGEVLADDVGLDDVVGPIRLRRASGR